MNNLFDRNVYVVKTEPKYPSKAPFHPKNIFGGYLFDENYLDNGNNVYEAVRNLLIEIGKDKEGFSLDNILGWLIKPGDRVVIKPNLIKESHINKKNDWEYIITHGSVVRAVADFVLVALKGKGEVIIGYNEEISFEKWNRIKGSIDRKAEISFYSSERGLLLVTFMKATDSNYLQKFFMHSEAVALFVEKIKKEGIILSPDFYSDTDVYTATSEEEAFSKYVNTNVRLVVIVDSNITESYKNLIVKLRTYDRFVRISAITSLSPANELEVLKAIKKSYLTDNFLE